MFEFYHQISNRNFVKNSHLYKSNPLFFGLSFKHPAHNPSSGRSKPVSAPAFGLFNSASAAAARGFNHPPKESKGAATDLPLTSLSLSLKIGGPKTKLSSSPTVTCAHCLQPMSSVGPFSGSGRKSGFTTTLTLRKSGETEAPKAPPEPTKYLM